MPEISRFFGIVVKMYYNDHQPPHFHAEYGEHVAEISLDSMEVIAGKLPLRALGLTLEWASVHRAELRDNWDLARAEQPLQSIEPLS